MLAAPDGAAATVEASPVDAAAVDVSSLPPQPEGFTVIDAGGEALEANGDVALEGGERRVRKQWMVVEPNSSEEILVNDDDVEIDLIACKLSELEDLAPFTKVEVSSVAPFRRKANTSKSRAYRKSIADSKAFKTPPAATDSFVRARRLQTRAVLISFLDIPSTEDGFYHFNCGPFFLLTHVPVSHFAAAHTPLPPPPTSPPSLSSLPCFPCTLSPRGALLPPRLSSCARTFSTRPSCKPSSLR